jgi:hypothetical protein
MTTYRQSIVQGAKQQMERIEELLFIIDDMNSPEATALVLGWHNLNNWVDAQLNPGW